MSVFLKKLFKILLSVYLCLLLIGTVSFFAVGNGICHFALERKPDTAYTDTEYSRWIVEEGEDRYITSEDGLTLHGHFVGNPDADGKYAIICHGYTGNATNMSAYAKKLYDSGFSVLCPNARAHGKSEGELIGMGYLERRDIIGWINEIVKNDPSAQILLFGVSMGGATVLFTSGEADLPANVRAVVSDCAFTSVYEEIGNVMRRYASFLPSFPIVDSGSVVCELTGGYSFRDASCVLAVKKSITPTLFIHGSKDTFVPFYMLDVLYENAGCEKEKLVIDDAAHANSCKTDPDLYWNTIKKFVENKFD